MISYWIAQVLGAIVAAVVLYLDPSGKAQGWTGSLGQNGWGAGYNGEYNVVSALVFEVVATFLFLVCILGVTHPIAPTGFAGLAIGLTLVVIHLVGINITGTSVNPARSIGPALVGIGSNPGRCRAALALHHRPAHRRGRCGLAVPHRSYAGRSQQALREPGGLSLPFRTGEAAPVTTRPQQNQCLIRPLRGLRRAAWCRLRAEPSRPLSFD